MSSTHPPLPDDRDKQAVDNRSRRAGFRWVTAEVIATLVTSVFAAIVTIIADSSASSVRFSDLIPVLRRVAIPALFTVAVLISIIGGMYALIKRGRRSAQHLATAREQLKAVYEEGLVRAGFDSPTVGPN